MREVKIDEIHSITLNLMDRLHDICEENGIRYFISYGTLIGAIRHKGFIPWDDDFDVFMFRNDYDKFIHVVEEKKDSRYRIVTRANTENYHYGIARYCDTKYRYHTELDVKQYDLGAFIDVYPMDACGETEEETERVHQKIKKLNAQYMVYCNKNSLTSKARTLIRIPYHYFLHIKYGKKFPQLIDVMERDLVTQTFDEHSKKVGIYWETRDFRYFEREWFAERIMWPFEDREYWIPKEYDKILTLQYGDYMTLPPENERVASHSYTLYEIDDEEQ